MDTTMVRRIRESGNVKRCHALVHNDPGYTDGKHSFDAVSMLLLLHPNPSVDLIKVMLWHDMAERYAGDLPASAKFASQDLRVEYEALEMRITHSHYKPLANAMANLRYDDFLWVSAIDALEFFLWCDDQLAMGNRHVEEARANIMEHLSSKNMPVQCLNFYTAYLNEGWRRLPERFDR